MNTVALEPTACLTLMPGGKTTYQGIAIKRCRSGSKFTINGRTGSDLLAFERNQGMARYRCIAALRGNELRIFEGATIGTSMISESMVRESLGMNS